MQLQPRAMGCWRLVEPAHQATSGRALPVGYESRIRWRFSAVAQMIGGASMAETDLALHGRQCRVASVCCKAHAWEQVRVQACLAEHLAA
jgi:hypothetical protein